MIQRDIKGVGRQRPLLKDPSRRSSREDFLRGVMEDSYCEMKFPEVTVNT